MSPVNPDMAAEVMRFSGAACKEVDWWSVCKMWPGASRDVSPEEQCSPGLGSHITPSHTRGTEVTCCWPNPLGLHEEPADKTEERCRRYL